MRIGRFLLHWASLLLIIKQGMEKLSGEDRGCGSEAWASILALPLTTVKSWAGYPTSPWSISLLETEDELLHCSPRNTSSVRY